MTDVDVQLKRPRKAPYVNVRLTRLRQSKGFEDCLLSDLVLRISSYSEGKQYYYKARLREGVVTGMSPTLSRYLQLLPGCKLQTLEIALSRLGRGWYIRDLSSPRNYSPRSYTREALAARRLSSGSGIRNIAGKQP